MKPFRFIFSSVFFIGVMIVLLFISFLSYQRISRLNQESDLVIHTDLVKLRLEQVLSYIKDGETSQRGYLITRDSNFLTPLHSARLSIQQTISDLDSLTSDNPKQQQNIDSLQKLVDLRMDRIYHGLYIQDRPKTELNAILLDGNRIMNLIKIRIADMQRIEEILLRERRETKDRSAALTPVYSLLFSVLAILILTIAYFRLRVESKLRLQAESSEAKIHTFFNEVPAILAILKGPEHRFEFANPSCVEFIGEANPVGKTVGEILPELETQGYKQLLDQVYAGSEPFVGKEMPLKLNKNADDGQPVFINFVFQPLPDGAGKNQGVLVFCYDVSALVSARKKMEETEQRTRLAIDAAELGTFDWDLKNEQFDSSPRLLDIFGFKGQFAVSHQNLIDCFHPADRLVRDRAVAESFTKGSLVYEARVIRNDKTVRWVNVYGKIVHGTNKKPERMYGTVMDITRQKTTMEELQESETRFRLLADSVPQLIWTGDAAGDLYYFNDAVFAFSGLKLPDIQRDGWINIVHPDDKQENLERWKQSIETGNEFIFEHRFRHASGKYRWMLSRARPQRDAEGHIQLWVGTSTDIDAQKNFMHELEERVKERTRSLQESNRQLENTVQELERINKELESFNYIASHDLQEPLRKIIAFSRRIEDKEKHGLSELSKDYFDRITGAATRMQNLIDGLLAYTMTKESDYVFEPVDLNLLISEVTQDLYDTIAEKKAILEYQDLPTLSVIHIQFYQLLINVIGNALKYSKRELPPVIRICASKVSGTSLLQPRARRDIHYWKISVEDNGIGFEQQYEYKIFELFQRLHTKSEYVGTGIGLAICKKIMNNHHGFISASGRSGDGATFDIFLPENIENETLVKID